MPTKSKRAVRAKKENVVPPMAKPMPHARCVHCRHVPLSANAMIGILTGLVVAMSVFLIDAASLL